MCICLLELFGGCVGLIVVLFVGLCVVFIWLVVCLFVCPIDWLIGVC